MTDNNREERMPTWLADSEVSQELYEQLWTIIVQSRLPPIIILGVLEIIRAGLVEGAINGEEGQTN